MRQWIPLALVFGFTLACVGDWSADPGSETDAAAEDTDQAPADPPPKTRKGRRGGDAGGGATPDTPDTPASGGGGGGGGGGGNAAAPSDEDRVMRAMQGTSLTVGRLPGSCAPAVEGAPADTPVGAWIAKTQKKASSVTAVCDPTDGGHACQLRLSKSGKRGESMLILSFSLDGSGALVDASMGCELAG